MVHLPVSKNDLAGNGIVVTDEASTFVNTASSSPGVEAVIIHKTRLAEVDPVWLKNLYDHQVVVAAVNVSLHDLGGFIGDGSISNDPAYTDGWQKEPFYSIIVWRSRGQPGTPGYGTDMIRSTDNIQGIAGTDIFLSLVRRNVQLLRGLQTYPAPPTP